MNSPKPNLLFETYFENIYGPRWQALKEKLGVPEKQVLRRNLFAENSAILSPILADAVAELADCYWKPDLFRLEKNTEGLYGYYVMDPASVITALALEARPDETVLDMCAAPGGKSLVLAEAMRSGNLILNEMSESRRERLNRVLHEYIPRDHRLFIAIKGLDGNQYGLRQPGVYDRVLADVPCSGERHLFENSSELSLWTVKRTKNLAIRQFSLLSSAWLSVKTGGR